jgi:hypothetical protein
MEDLLFENRSQWANLADPEPIFESFAERLDLDLEQFRADFNDPTIENLITIDETSADALGVSATPTFFLNGQLIDNPATYEDFQARVQAEIDAVQSAPAPMVSVTMVDAQTARVTVDPESGFVGTLTVRVGVRDDLHGTDGPSYRFQDVTVTVTQ